MDPQNNPATTDERTTQLPAQEALSLEPQQPPALSAEQVYTQRQLERLPDGSPSTPTFIP